MPTLNAAVLDRNTELTSLVLRLSEEKQELRRTVADLENIVDVGNMRTSKTSNGDVEASYANIIIMKEFVRGPVAPIIGDNVRLK